MQSQIHLGRSKIAERAFRRGEEQVEQAAGGIIDEDQEGTARCTVLEPGIRRTIQLHQFAHAGAALPKGVNHGLGMAWPPQVRLDHQPPHRLAAKFQVMDFGQLLVSEGGSKIGVAGLQQGERTFLGLGIELVVTGLSAFLREQPRGTKPAIAFQQPLDLADAETQLLGGLPLFDLALVESAHDLHTPKFFLAHLENVAHFLLYPFL